MRSGTDLMVGKVWYERHLLVTSMLRGRPVPMRKPRGGTIYGGRKGAGWVRKGIL